MLEIAQLTKTFPSQEIPVLSNLNLRIEKGEFCIILGSNGSGKSTLLKLLAGDYQADCGNIKLGGIDITKDPIHKRASLISYVTQDTNQGTIPSMTLLENLALSNLRQTKPDLKFYVQKQLADNHPIKLSNLDFEWFLHTPLSSLSGGQRQSAALAMALLSAPQLLLLDEHTSALDPQTQKKIMEHTAHYIEKHRLTCLMITHNMEDALRYGSRLIMLSQGQIVLDIKEDEKKALTKEKLAYLFFGKEARS